jgi:hypothetical protein
MLGLLMGFRPELSPSARNPKPVPAPTVARRAGHSVDVLLRVHANCIDGDDGIANGRISDALS